VTEPVKPYIRIYDTVYNSIAFRTLPDGALKVWMDMRTQYKGWNNGSLMATLTVLKQRGVEFIFQARASGCRTDRPRPNRLYASLQSEQVSSRPAIDSTR